MRAISEIRKAMYMNQEEFAISLGVSSSAVKKWEMRGQAKRQPSLRSQKKIIDWCEKNGVEWRDR